MTMTNWAKWSDQVEAMVCHELNIGPKEFVEVDGPNVHELHEAWERGYTVRQAVELYLNPSFIGLY